MNSVEIIGAPISNFVRSVRMAAALKNVPYDLVLCGPHSEPIKAVNPFGKIPALRHGDVELYETIAILAYLDLIGEGPDLQPKDPMDRIHMLQWCSIIQDHLYQAIIRQIILEQVFPQGPEGTIRQDQIADGFAKTKKHLPVIERALDDNCYLVGNALSLADLMLLPVLAYLKEAPGGAELLEPFPNICRALHKAAEKDWFTSTLPPKKPKSAA